MQARQIQNNEENVLNLDTGEVTLYVDKEKTKKIKFNPYDRNFYFRLLDFMNKMKKGEIKEPKTEPIYKKGEEIPVNYEQLREESQKFENEIRENFDNVFYKGFMDYVFGNTSILSINEKGLNLYEELFMSLKPYMDKAKAVHNKKLNKIAKQAKNKVKKYR